jgi:acyl dehydratase
MTAPIDTLTTGIGVTLYSDWLPVDQSMIDRFADATLDHQFIHVDPVKAADTPFGGTVAHGFLTLSLLPALLGLGERTARGCGGLMLNYGFDRVRFVHPVRPGNRVRAVSTLLSHAEKRPGQFQQSMDLTIEIEGVAKPALTATWLSQILI